jgi:hypothetical protein
MNEKQKVRITDLFTDKFIQRQSTYKSLQEMVKASGVDGIENVLTPPCSIFCTYKTDFNNWEAMCKAAQAEYLQRSRRAESPS